MSRKSFTVGEANALIPLLEAVLEGIAAHRTTAESLHERLQLLDVLWGDRLLEPDNPDRAEAVTHRSALRTALLEIERAVQEEILGRGVRFPQGGLEHGLLDFPTGWEGRWVYLCWQRGEPRVTAWHETGAGYAGRQPLTPRQEREMGTTEPFDLDDQALEF